MRMLAGVHAYDPRLTLARADLAEQALEGILPAAVYAPVQPMQCQASVAAVRASPDLQARQNDQLIFGEAFDVVETSEGWAWGQARRDGYVGWVELSELAAPILSPTHRVCAIRTYAFSQPDLMSSQPRLLNLNSLVCVEDSRDRFLKVARAGWVAESHLAALDDFATDPVAVAEQHLGAPYQWGGRESVGLDCSGLVQQALFACGRACPRDADMQAEALGSPVAGSASGAGQLRRGDLVFWSGHVAMMLDAASVIHANGWRMQVSVDPLADVVARVGPPVALRRL